jgi:hypothetical protein
MEVEERRREMRTSVKTPLVILSALAHIAGCNLGLQKDAFLRAGDEGVMFIRWTREGNRIRGTVDLLAMTPDNNLAKELVTLDGQSDGQTVTMTWKSSWAPKSIEVTGALVGDTLMLSMAEGKEPVEFRRATHAEYVEASRKLELRAKLNKGAK